MLTTVGAEHFSDGYGAQMEFSKLKLADHSQVHTLINPTPLKRKVDIKPADMFNAILSRGKIQEPKIKAFWKAYDISYVGFKRWKEAGFVKAKYDKMCEDMGKEWNNAFKEVLEYAVNYAIWHLGLWASARRSGKDPTN